MQKINKSLIVALILSILIIFILGSYIVYDKVLNKETKQKSSENYSEISIVLDRYIFSYAALFSYLGEAPDFENNIENRLSFTQWVLLQDGEVLHSGEDYKAGQDFVYVSKKDFEEKYNKIFGNEYNFTEDLEENEKRCTSMDCACSCVDLGETSSEVNEYLNSDNYISWVTTYGVSMVYKNTVIKVEKKDDNYIISGTYELYNPDETEKLKEGDFSVVYAKKGNDSYLKRVLFNES